MSGPSNPSTRSPVQTSISLFQSRYPIRRTKITLHVRAEFRPDLGSGHEMFHIETIPTDDLQIDTLRAKVCLDRMKIERSLEALTSSVITTWFWVCTEDLRNIGHPRSFDWMQSKWQDIVSLCIKPMSQAFPAYELSIVANDHPEARNISSTWFQKEVEDFQELESWDKITQAMERSVNRWRRKLRLHAAYDENYKFHFQARLQSEPTVEQGASRAKLKESINRVALEERIVGLRSALLNRTLIDLIHPNSETEYERQAPDILKSIVTSEDHRDFLEMQSRAAFKEEFGRFLNSIRTAYTKKRGLTVSQKNTHLPTEVGELQHVLHMYDDLNAHHGYVVSLSGETVELIQGVHMQPKESTVATLRGSWAEIARSVNVF